MDNKKLKNQVALIREVFAYEFEEAVGKIGQVLHGLITGKPNFNKPVEEIGSRRIQRYEQRQIKKELSGYLDSGK